VRSSTGIIVKRIVFYSTLALVGMGLLALGGFAYMNTGTLMVAVIVGLAVLTAPHMGVMHVMYARMRDRN
jgi:hypothetical protein